MSYLITHSSNSERTTEKVEVYYSSPADLDYLLETVEYDYREIQTFIWTWQETLYTIPLGIITALTIFGNLLVLYATFTRQKHLRQPAHLIIANLSVADLFVGILVMPVLIIMQLTGKWQFGSIFCEIWTVIHFLLCATSILSTTAVCIERYIGVRFPLKHKHIMNKRRIRIMNVGVWWLAGVLVICSLYIWPHPKPYKPNVCPINREVGHVIVAIIGMFYVPAGIMIVLYWRIYRIANKHMQFLRKNSSLSASMTLSTKNSNQGFSKLWRTISKKFLFKSEEDSSSMELELSSVNMIEAETNGNHQKLEPAKSNPLSKEQRTINPKASLVLQYKQRKQFNYAKRLGFLVGILLVSYFPLFTIHLVMAFDGVSINQKVFNVLCWLRYFNSCINPFIYAFTMPAYRKAMFEIFTSARHKMRQRFCYCKNA